MLLIPFVENAFKHGALQDGLLRIRITIGASLQTLKFRIENSAHPSRDISGENGLGLDNFEKRLALHYSGNYHLECGYSEGWYRAALTINNLQLINENRED